MDTSSIYVRGEENLGEWKPRGISLLDEHQSHLDKLERIQEVSDDSHGFLLGFLCMRKGKKESKPWRTVRD